MLIRATIRNAVVGRGSWSDRARLLMALLAGLALLGVSGSVGSIDAWSSPRQFAGSPGVLPPSADPFYSSRVALYDVAPGTVLKTRQVSILPVNGKGRSMSALQVLYRTTGELGQPSSTVATVIAAQKSGVHGIVSFQIAYDGLGANCDPSYELRAGQSLTSDAALEASEITSYLDAGFSVVTADYEGPNSEFLVGQESGYGVLDGIRAAENALGLSPARTPVGLIGYSGGALATDYAAQLAARYAPRLDLVGVAEGGVPVDYFHILSYVEDSPEWSVVIPMGLVGLTRGFHLDPDRYFSSYGAKLAEAVGSKCLSSAGSYAGLTIRKMLKAKYPDLERVPALVTIMNRMIMGRSGTPREPMLLANGISDRSGDGVMVERDVQALAYSYCRRGLSVAFHRYSGLSHLQAYIPFEISAYRFITDRLHGSKVPDGCKAIGPASSLAPVK